MLLNTTNFLILILDSAAHLFGNRDIYASANPTGAHEVD